MPASLFLYIKMSKDAFASCPCESAFRRNMWKSVQMKRHMRLIPGAVHATEEDWGKGISGLYSFY